MKIRKIAAVAVTAVLTVTMLTGCTTFNNFKEAFLQKKRTSDVTFKMGIFELMSGPEGDAARPELKGTDRPNERPKARP
mgnify:CR=1 FL=1